MVIRNNTRVSKFNSNVGQKFQHYKFGCMRDCPPGPVAPLVLPNFLAQVVQSHMRKLEQDWSVMEKSIEFFIHRGPIVVDVHIIRQQVLRVDSTAHPRRSKQQAMSGRP